MNDYKFILFNQAPDLDLSSYNESMEFFTEHNPLLKPIINRLVGKNTNYCHFIDHFGPDDCDQFVATIYKNPELALDKKDKTVSAIEKNWTMSAIEAVLYTRVASLLELPKPKLEEFFIATLLKNVGLPSIFSDFSQISGTDKWCFNKDSSLSVESDFVYCLTISMAPSVGGIIAHSWGLPESIVKIIINHRKDIKELTNSLYEVRLFKFVEYSLILIITDQLAHFTMKNLQKQNELLKLELSKGTLKRFYRKLLNSPYAYTKTKDGFGMPEILAQFERVELAKKSKISLH